MQLNKKVVACLKTHPGIKFTRLEIATWILKTYPADCQAKKKCSGRIKTNQALLQQIASEIKWESLQKIDPRIQIIQERPLKFVYTDSSDVISSGPKEPVLSLKESELYPKLSQFLRGSLEILTIRIDEKRSRNTRGKGGNRWLFPDIVGLEDLSHDWDREVKDCVKQYADKKTRLYSFEVKRTINRNNVREYFFQAVSNSSWANFGYLVGVNIDKHAEQELQILSGSHGIGLIRLCATCPERSQMMIYAKEKSTIDWNTVNRLTRENTDFRDYIKGVRQFYQTGDLSKWMFSTTAT